MVRSLGSLYHPLLAALALLLLVLPLAGCRPQPGASGSEISAKAEKPFLPASHDAEDATRIRGNVGRRVEREEDSHGVAYGVLIPAVDGAIGYEASGKGFNDPLHYGDRWGAQVFLDPAANTAVCRAAISSR